MGVGSKIAQLWDAAGRPLGTPMRHEADVTCVGFSLDGKTILTASGDGQQIAVTQWDAATCRRIGRPSVWQGRGKPVAFSPDRRTLLTGGDHVAQSGTSRVPVPGHADGPAERPSANGGWRSAPIAAWW